MIHTLGITSTAHYVLVVTLPLETKTAVSGDNQKRISHLILDTHLMHEDIEVSVNIAANDNALCFWKFEQIHKKFYLSSDLSLEMRTGRLNMSSSRLEMPVRVVRRLRSAIEPKTSLMISMALAFVSI